MPGERDAQGGQDEDIDSLRRRVRALEEEARALRDLVDNLDVGVFTMEDAGGSALLSRANPALARILGYPSAEAMIGQSAFEHYSDPKERSETQAHFMASPEFRESGVVRLEGIRIRRDTREPVPILLRLKATFDEQGRIDRFYGVMEDTRDRKRVEKAFEASEARFASMFEASPVGTALTDLAGVVVRTNRALQQLVGRADEELLGRSFDSLAGSQAVSVLDLARSGHEHPLEASFTRGDGTVAWGLVTAALLRDAEGNPTQGVVMVQDVTHRKQMEQELLRAAKLESLALMAGGIAHDFNNLLTPILGNVSIALAKADPETRTALLYAEHAAWRARDLARQLMTFARGGVTVKTPGLVASVVAECAELCVRGTNVRCELDVERDTWSSSFDAGQMVQVFSNLLINAVQAMPDGGVVTCTVRNVTLEDGGVQGLPPGRYVRASVRDHGVGIPAENLGRIFDPFFSTKTQGRGLGLATTHAIVTAHGGRIEVDSDVGRGTEFAVIVPASDRPHAANDVGAPPTSSSPEATRLLVMDDERPVRETTTAMLASCGYEVDAVADGDEALDAYARARRDGRPYAAVILDLTVRGGRGGADTMARLLEQDAGARGIVASGYSSGAVVEDPLGAGFRGFVQKPYTLAELSEAVASVLADPKR